MRRRLSKLHQHIIRNVPCRDLALRTCGDLFPLFGEDVVVNALLLWVHFTVLDAVGFAGEVFEDVNFATTEDKGCHHCFGASDALLGEEGGGGACGGGGFEFEDAF